MYILIIARGYPSKKYKMNGIFEYDQAKALAKMGHKVVYTAVDARSIVKKRNWGFESFKRDGIHIEVLNIPLGKLSWYFNDINKFSLKVLYQKIAKNYGIPDIIHSHFIRPSYTTARALNKLNIPMIMTEHYSGINNDKIGYNLLKLGKYTYPKMNKVIAVSEYLAKNIEKNFNIVCEVIPNIVDTSTFNFNFSTNIKKDNRKFTFISVGNLRPIKRMDLLIKSFNEAFNTNDNVELYIYGDGPEKEKLQRMIKNYNLSNKVYLMGLADRKQIARKMVESDCFILLSKRETFGVAYIEAMAMGLPVIASMSGGPESFINKSNGIILDKTDINSVANAMKQICNKIHYYNRDHISKQIINKFSPEAIGQKLTDIYSNILYGKGNDGYNDVYRRNDTI